MNYSPSVLFAGGAQNKNILCPRMLVVLALGKVAPSGRWDSQGNQTMLIYNLGCIRNEPARSVSYTVSGVSPSSCVCLAYVSHRQMWASSVHTPREVLCQNAFFLWLSLWQHLMLLSNPCKQGHSTTPIKEIQTWSGFRSGKTGLCLPPVYHLNGSWVCISAFQTTCFWGLVCIAELCHSSLSCCGLVLSIT